jgi:hypothetical protein
MTVQGRVDLDLGHGHTLRYMGWAPDRTIEANRVRFEGYPDVERWGAILAHTDPTGRPCEGMVTFDGEIQQALSKSPKWTVESWDPLTLSPSVLCSCGDHGFIRDGRWVPA